ncbi:MAG TPA: isoprenylcysteine carboxylmethyltransferase family protein [Gemmatimonadaceae bacterium]|nr:isoprenylcysteine carboxylmethyltransferase family protein [Gemmatimonadaceae bacterium]
MIVLLRHLLAIAALPFVVTVLIPIWIARRYGMASPEQASMGIFAAQTVGFCLIAIGGLLFVHSVRRFAVDGEGTLAPWDPPRHLVVRGPYRYVRNPMISGVIFILFGEALILYSESHFLWAVSFLAINALSIPLFEEPQLRQRFGEPYAEYCKHVPRLVPRLRPWQPATPPG